VGTENGLSVFDNNNLSPSAEDIKTIKFINITNNPKDSTSISSNGIQVIFEDSFGNIWFGTDDGFLNKLEAQNISLRNFNFVKFRMHWKKDQNKINLLFDDIVEDRNHPGLFWLVNYYQGISWFNSKSGDFFYQYPYHEMPSNFPISQVESCFWDSEGKFWFGTFSDGIYTFKPEKNNNSSKSFEHFILNSTENKGINVADITCFYEDKSGMIWIGTSTNGLYTYYNGVKRFTGFFNNPLSKNSLSGKDALSVLETNNGNIWIGTESGLDNYNPVTKKFTHYKYNPYNLHSLSDNTVYSLFQDSKSTLWVGTVAGLDKYDPSTDSFLHYKNNPSDPNSLSAGEIIKIFSDSKGSLWVGSWKKGLNKLVPGLNGNADHFLHYKFDKNDPYSISDNNIMSMAEDKSGQLWIGTSEGGLNKLISDYALAEDGSIISPKFKRYQHSLNIPDCLSNNDVRALFVDKKGILWVGTLGGGLNRFIPGGTNEGTAKFIHYTQLDGLANDDVRSILEDETGNLWIGTAHGLSKFNPEKNNFRNLYESDGLQTSKYEDVSYKSKRNGMMFFGGINGVVEFQPDEMVINHNIPQIVITSLKRYNTSDIKGIAIEEKGISEKKEIILSYKDNIITFEFAALNFYNSLKNTYAYKLNGYNENWIQLGSKRDVTFTNLDPGQYVLQVKGANNDGFWNEQGLSLHIIITPPWWRSKWAYSLYFLLLILGVFITDRIMRRNVINIERNKAKLHEAELIKKQADELETVDRLVKIINRAENLDILFNSLLKQTLSFIPQGEKAAVFLLNKNENLFKIAFNVGYTVKDLENISFTPGELKKRYTEKAEEIEKGIYVLNNTENLFGDDKFS
jgi:ligand-binding sensor domain-containing protein